MVTQDQARVCARNLYPELWQTDRVTAIAKAIEFVFEAAAENEPLEISKTAKTPIHKNSTKLLSSSGIVKTLADHMARHRLHVNVVARALAVSGYTVRTWLEGKYVPNETNAEKITRFIHDMEATPEILTPNS